MSVSQGLSFPLPAAISAKRGGRMPDPGRLFGLDLMRAVAVAMVLACHWTGHFLYWFHGDLPRLAAVADSIGDTGVELFFALSGFLIGRILIGIVSSRPAWRDYGVFLLRRAMRTLPLYFLWLGLLLAVFPPDRDAVCTALRFITLTQNLITPMPPDYYFAVTWSLAIEEWFYLLFGLAFIALARRCGGGPALVWCLLLFMAVPVALRLICQDRGAMVVQRLDEIAYGVLMAALYLRGSPVFRRPWPLLAAGLLLIGVGLTSHLLPVADGVPAGLAAALAPNLQITGCALCLPAALRLTRAAVWIEAPVRWIAARSYALYLMHLTLLYDVVEKGLFETGLLSAPGCVIVAVLLPFPLADLSFRLLEMPMLRLRPRQTSCASDAPVAYRAAVAGG